MMRRCFGFTKLLLMIVMIIGLTSCAAQFKQHGMYYKGVRVRTNEAVLVFPLPKKYHKVYLKVINHSARSNACIQQLRHYIIHGLRAQGFTVVRHASQAYFKVTLNLLLVRTIRLVDANLILLRGYGGPTVGGGVGPLSQRTVNETLTYPHRLAYTMVADLTVLQRAKSHGSKSLTIQKDYSWHTYVQRIVLTYSHELNPPCFSDVMHAFVVALARQVSNVF